MRIRLEHRRLAELLARRPLSLNRWAMKIGVSSGHLSQLVNGKRPYPRAKTRRRLLAALEVEQEELFEIERPAAAEGAPRRRWPRRLPMDRPRAPRRSRTVRLTAGADMLERLYLDFRLALRQLRRQPGFALAAVLILGLGIGLNSAQFSMIYTTLWKPLPVHQPERLFYLFSTDPERDVFFGTLSYPELVDFRERSAEVIEVAGSDWEPFGLAGGERPLRIGGGQVTHNYFEVLGVTPLLGRTFRADEDRPGGAPVMLLSEGLWHSYLGADPDAVGRSLELNGVPHTIVGVVPEPVDFPGGAHLWVPLALDPSEAPRTRRYLSGLARLQPGVSREQGEGALTVTAAGLAAEFPDSNQGRGARLTGIRDFQLRGGGRQISLLLLAAVSFVLLIVCANVAHLLLVRGARRGREMALHAALGAGRRRLAAQLFAESVVLCAAGGLLGLLLARWGIRAMAASIPVEMPGWMRFELEPAAILYTAGISLSAALLCGLAPVVQALSADLVRGLKANADHGRMRRLRGGLAVAEVAISLALLAGAALVVQSLLALAARDPGFRQEGVLTAGIDLLAHAEKPVEERHRMISEYLDRLAAIPGVTAAAMVDRIPLGSSSNYNAFAVEGRPGDDPRDNSALVERVSGGYFAAMGIPIYAGTPFGDRPGTIDKPVAVSRSLADRYWPGEDPIGRRLGLDGRGGGWSQVVAVVGEVHHHGVDEPAPPTVYRPYWGTGMLRMSWVLATDGDPLALVDPLRAAVAEIDPSQPLHAVEPLSRLVAASNWQWRLVGRMLGLFAALAVTLAMLGLYSVMAYSVARRSRELGVRMALGARQGEVLRLVLRQGLTLTGIGLLLGIPLALGLGRVLGSILYGLDPVEPAVLVSVVLLLGAVSAVAILLPARRAAAIDPMVAIRDE